MNVLERLVNRTKEDDIELLADLVETAKYAILSRRFPYKNWPTDPDTGDTCVEPQYEDLQYRIALDLYNKQGAEGELRHDEHSVTRTYESSWISAQLLQEITPYCGTVR